ncbi:MAG: acyltransferase [Pirellulaceae bacterium]
MEQSNKPIQLDALTGLRFFAAFLVFVHHVAGKFNIPELHIPLGAYPVSFFFVLSGFILTYSYRDRLNNWNDIKGFWGNRIARIWPLHFVCLAIFLVVWCPIQYLPQRLSTNSMGVQLIANIFLLQAWVPSNQWALSFNGVSWSISVESFFYFMFPVLIMGGPRRFFKIYLALIGGSLLLMTGLSILSNRSGTLANVDLWALYHFNPALRLLEFATGIAACTFMFRAKTTAKRWSIWRSTVLELATVTLLFLFLYFARPVFLYPWLHRSMWSPATAAWLVYCAPMFVFAGLVCVFAQTRGPLGWVCSRKPLVYLGEISFAFYMVHHIVLLFLRTRLNEFQLPPATAFVGALVVSLVMSHMLFQFVETPIRKFLREFFAGRKWEAVANLSRQWSQQLAIPSSLIAALVCVVAFQSMALYSGFNVDGRVAKRPDLAVNQTLTSPPPPATVLESLPYPIQFGEQLELQRFSQVWSDSGLTIQTKWNRELDEGQHVFVHLLDEDKRFICAAPTPTNFVEANGGWECSQTVTWSHLPETRFVGIGIRSQNSEQPYLKVASGPRTFDDQRLTITLNQAEQQRFAASGNVVR